MAVSTFVHLFDHIELIGHAGGQRERYRVGARRSVTTTVNPAAAAIRNLRMKSPYDFAFQVCS